MNHLLLRQLVPALLFTSLVAACGDDTGGTGGGDQGGGGGTGGTTPTTSTSSTGGSESGCEALCRIRNTSLEANGCQPEACDKACIGLDRPGCEAEGDAVAACQAAGADIDCTCSGNVRVCSISGAVCFDEQVAYDACEGECVQQGGGTPEQASASFDAYCVELNDLSEEVCGAGFDCDALAGLFLDSAVGCEAEFVTVYDCAEEVLAMADPSTCTCEGGQLSCPVFESTCVAESAAFESCAGCD